MGIALQLPAPVRLRIVCELLPTAKVDERRGEVHSCCPFHQEKNPSFSYSFQQDVFNCFSCHAKGDLVSLWAHVKGIDPKEAFKLFCETYNLARDAKGSTGKNHPPKDAPGKSTATRPKAPDLEGLLNKLGPLPEELKDDLERSRGWSRPVMERTGLRLQTHYFYRGKIVEAKTPERVAIPIHDAQGRLVNIRFYKRGATEGKMISAAPGTGESRLYPALIPINSDDPVIVCEGEPDVLCGLSHGLNCVTQTSKKHIWPEEHLEPFRGRHVVIAYDADEPGQGYATAAAASLHKVAKSVRLLQWPDFMGRLDDCTWPAKGGQDLTDYFIRHGKSLEDFKTLLAEAKPWTDQDAADLDQQDPMQYFERGPNDRFGFKPGLLSAAILKKHTIKYDPDTRLFYQWNEKIYEEFSEERLRTIIRQYLGTESTKGRGDDCVYHIRRDAEIPPGRKMNDQPDMICVENGILNLRTLVLRDHSPDDLVTILIPVFYNPDSGRKCDRFLLFMEQTVQSRGPIMQIQEFVGYCLTQSKEHAKCLLLLGPGADGKSLLFNIMVELVGEANCSHVSFEDLEDQFQRAALFGKLLNVSTEIGSKALESRMFKAMVGNDRVQAAFKFEKPFSFQFTGKMAFASNRLPRVLDQSDGFFRRILPIEFKRQFLEDGDGKLFDELKLELSEIFQWALAGLHRLWDQGGFTVCEETELITQDYRFTNSPIMCFRQDCTNPGNNGDGAKKDRLYYLYRKYCMKYGYQAYNAEHFFKELYAQTKGLASKQIKEKDPETGEIKRPRIVTGITIDEDAVFMLELEKKDDSR